MLDVPGAHCLTVFTQGNLAASRKQVVSPAASLSIAPWWAALFTLFLVLMMIVHGPYFKAREHASNDVVMKVPVRSYLVSSEDRRTPVRGQAVKQSTELRSALEFFATAHSFRERSLESVN